MNISVKRMCYLLNCSESTLRTYIARFPKIKWSKKNKMLENVYVSDINKLRKLIHTRKRQSDDIYMPRHKFEKEYEIYYNKPNDYKQIATRCINFNYSYNPDDSDTCYARYNSPCKCRVLNNKKCDFLEFQIGDIQDEH